MLTNGKHQSAERLAFCERYVEKIIDRLTDPEFDGEWSVADAMLNACPRHYLSDVAFLFLTYHFEAIPYTKKEELY